MESTKSVMIIRMHSAVSLPMFRNVCSAVSVRTQQPTQSFDAFLTELRLQAKKCAYGTLTNERIRDRLVVGIRDDKVRSRLLREPDLTLQRCIDVAHAAEISQA